MSPSVDIIAYPFDVEVGDGCFGKAGGEVVGFRMSFACIDAPSCCIKPFRAVSGGVDVNADQDDVSLAECGARGVYAVCTLFERMKGFRTDIMKLNRTEMMPDTAFDMSIHEMTTALPLLYQSGYLTIKGYSQASSSYILGIPNDEVRVGLFENFISELTPLNTDQRMNMVDAMNRALRRGDVDAAMKALQSFLSEVPYMYEGREILEDLEKLEALHQRDLYILFNGMGLNLETEVRQAKGRVDMVVWLPDAIYIFEFKMRGTASSALAQIEKNRYDAPYMADPRPKVKVGVRFTCTKHTITSWKVAR